MIEKGDILICTKNYCIVVPARLVKIKRFVDTLYSKGKNNV
jgi:hypothetical protein